MSDNQPRELDGRLKKGATLGQGNPLCQYVHVTRQRVYAYWTPDKLDEINRELYDLCLHAADPKVKLHAIQYVHDRVLGKVKDELEINVRDDRPAFDVAAYSDEQLAQIIDILDRPARPALREPEPVLVWPLPESEPVKDHPPSDTPVEVAMKEAFDLLDNL